MLIVAIARPLEDAIEDGDAEVCAMGVWSGPKRLREAVPQALGHGPQRQPDLAQCHRQRRKVSSSGFILEKQIAQPRPGSSSPETGSFNPA